MNYKEWINLLKKPLNINWSEPLTEEEKIKVSSHLPQIAELLVQEQKELRLLKKLSDKFEREAGAKDSEISKERLRMRLRKKLANNMDAKAKEKEGLIHSCSKDCERCLRKRTKKILAANKIIDVTKSNDPDFSEEQQQNLEGEKNHYLHQYREPDKGNDDDEKEENGQNDEAEEDVDNDVEELGAAVNTLSQDYSSTYKDSDLSEKHQQHKLKMQEKMDHCGNVAEGRHLNPYLPSHNFDNDRHRYDKGEEVKSDEDDDDAVHGLKMNLLEMSEEPQQSASTSLSSQELDFSKDFSKFLNYKYQF